MVCRVLILVKNVRYQWWIVKRDGWKKNTERAGCPKPRVTQLLPHKTCGSRNFFRTDGPDTPIK